MRRRNPRLGRSYDAWKQSDDAGDRLLEHGRTDILERNYTNARASVVVLPPSACRKSLLCGKPGNHLGHCDMTERLELVDTDSKGVAK